MDLVTFSSESSKGPFLNINEDGYDFDFDKEIFMLFDGFGGHGIGDKCVKELGAHIKDFYNQFVLDHNMTMPFFYSAKYLLEGNALINAALSAHKNLVSENNKKDISARAGASAVLMAKAESIMNIVSIGNCRAYLLRRGKIINLFTDDSMQYLGREAHEPYLRNIPLAGFGLFPDLHYQVRELRIREGDSIVTLTDGVYSKVLDEEINATVLRPVVNIKNKIVDLFELANERGNMDNQSCQILSF